MLRPFSYLLGTFGSWRRQQETFIKQAATDKNLDRRIEGYIESERVDAKILLVGAVPIFFTLLLHEAGWSNTWWWPIAYWISMGWLAIIGVIGAFPYFRLFIKHLRERH